MNIARRDWAKYQARRETNFAARDGLLRQARRMCGGVDYCSCQPVTKTQTGTKVMQLDMGIRWDFFLGRFFFSLIIVLIFKIL